MLASSDYDLDEVLRRVMDEVITVTRAERGFLMLRDAGGRLQLTGQVTMVVN